MTIETRSQQPGTADHITPIDHRVLGLAIHGIGQQKLGTTLKYVLSEMLPLVRQIDKNSGVSARPLDEGDPAEVVIRFRGESTKTANVEGYELKFKEVWWANTFEPPAVTDMVFSMPALAMRLAQRPGAGPLQAMTFLIGASLRRILSDFAQVLLAVLLAVPALVATLLSLGAEQRIGEARRWFLLRAAHGQTAIAEIVVVLASPFVLVLVLMPLRVIEFVIPSNLRPDGLAKFRLMLVKIFTEHLGDMWLYLYRPWEASRIRYRLEERFREIVEEVKDQNAEGRVECVMVIAHSMGAVVTYEALTGRRIRDLIDQNFGRDGQPKLYVATVGAGLNLAWRLVPEVEEGRLIRPLSTAASWHDFWTEFDPVPRGRLTLPPSLAALFKADRVEDHKVVNQVDVFSDHTSYWNNAEEVLAPLLDLATDHHFSERLNLNKAAREDRVYVLSGFKGLAWLAAPVTAAAVALGGGADLLTEQIVNVLGVSGDVTSALGALGAAGAGAAAVVIVYSTLIKWRWNRWDRRVKYRPVPFDRAALVTTELKSIST
jgi:hypothetical protein